MRRTLLCCTLLAASAAAQLPPIERERRDEPLALVLHVAADRSAGPVDTLVEEDVPLPRLMQLCSAGHGRLADGTLVQIDSAPGPRLRLRFVAKEPLTAGEHAVTLRPIHDAPETEFAFETEDGWSTLRHGDRLVTRFGPVFDPERREETFKAFHHLFAPDGRTRLTKGAGGEYAHHRGVFCGFSRTRSGERTLDFWHGERELSLRWRAARRSDVGSRPRARGVTADSVESIAWCDPKGETVVEELRALSVWDVGPGASVLDFVVTLGAPGDQEVVLDGDAHHGGFQVRLRDEVHDGDRIARYVRSPEARDVGDDRFEDCRWVACRFAIEDEEFEVQQHAGPGSPDVFSTRPYGRFGSFAKLVLEPGEPAELRYRLIVTDAGATARFDPAEQHRVYTTAVTARTR